RPSVRLSTSGTLPKFAAACGTQPAQLPKQVRGELDWIVMRCLEKDRTRRYETVNGLAMDVARRLAGEPVMAAPPSAVYRLRKVLRRHSRLVGAGVAAVLALAAFAGYAWIQAGRFAELAISERNSRESADRAGDAARDAQAQATRERDEARRAQEAEAKHRQVADREAERARQRV